MSLDELMKKIAQKQGNIDVEVYEMTNIGESQIDVEYLVMPSKDGQWEVRKKGAKKASSIFDKKEDAIERAKKMWNGQAKVIVYNSPGIKLETQKKAEVIDKPGKKIRKIRENIDEWTSDDYVRYIAQLFWIRYKKPFGLNFAPCKHEFKDVQAKISSKLGFLAPNFIAKDYVDFFFTHFADDCVRRTKRVYMKEMAYLKYINAFLKNYDVKEAHAKYVKQQSAPTNSVFDLSPESLELSFSSGSKSLVINFGVIIAINWLYMVKKKSQQECVEIVTSVLKEISGSKNISVIRGATEKWSPYPTWFPFKKHDRLALMVSPRLVAKEVVFLDTQEVLMRYNFFNGENDLNGTQ